MTVGFTVNYQEQFNIYTY